MSLNLYPTVTQACINSLSHSLKLNIIPGVFLLYTVLLSREQLYLVSAVALQRGVGPSTVLQMLSVDPHLKQQFSETLP
jgi:hypothetical protein